MEVIFKTVRSWTGTNPNGRNFICCVGDTINVKVRNPYMLPESIRAMYNDKPFRFKITGITESKMTGFVLMKSGETYQVSIKADDVIQIKVVCFVTPKCVSSKNFRLMKSEE